MLNSGERERRLLQAALLGDGAAMLALGRAWRFRHPQKSQEWFWRAIDQGRVEAVRGVLPRLMFEGLLRESLSPRLRRALDVLEQAAILGDLSAGYELGALLYLHGEHDAGKRWMVGLAGEGDRWASLSLAVADGEKLWRTPVALTGIAVLCVVGLILLAAGRTRREEI